jgi:hypothetical protein
MLGTGIDCGAAPQSIPVPNSNSGVDYRLPDYGGAGVQITRYFGYHSSLGEAVRYYVHDRSRTYYVLDVRAAIHLKQLC